MSTTSDYKTEHVVPIGVASIHCTEVPDDMRRQAVVSHGKARISANVHGNCEMIPHAPIALGPFGKQIVQARRRSTIWSTSIQETKPAYILVWHGKRIVLVSICTIGL